MYPENPEGTQVIVGSMNMGYISDTARNRTHDLFRPKREPIPLGHSDGQFFSLHCWLKLTLWRYILCLMKYHIYRYFTRILKYAYFKIFFVINFWIIILNNCCYSFLFWSHYILRYIRTVSIKFLFIRYRNSRYTTKRCHHGQRISGVCTFDWIVPTFHTRTHPTVTPGFVYITRYIRDEEEPEGHYNEIIDWVRAGSLLQKRHYDEITEKFRIRSLLRIFCSFSRFLLLLMCSSVGSSRWKPRVVHKNYVDSSESTI